MNTIKIVQLCLANALRDECSEKYRYGMRHEKFNKYIKDLNGSINQPSIICIKELRRCFNKERNSFMTYKTILDDFIKDTPYLIAVTCNVKPDLTIDENYNMLNDKPYNPFFLAQLYDPNIFYLNKTHIFNYYKEIFGLNKLPYMGTSMLAVQYTDKKTNQSFIVESFHLPIKEEHKNKVCEWIRDKEPTLRKTIFEQDNNDLTVIRIGDFNTFHGFKDCEKQLECLQANGFKYVSKNKYALQDSLKKVNGTFYPFLNDNTVKISYPTNETNYSELDYVFLYDPNNTIQEMKCEVDLLDINNQLSDHFPLYFSFINN